MRSHHPTTSILICDFCKTLHDGIAGGYFLPLGWFHLEYTSQPHSTASGVKSLHFDSKQCMDRFMFSAKDYHVNEKKENEKEP